jgi:hypothetical protein
LTCRMMSSTNRDTLTRSIPICIPFISSSCLITLARISRTLLIKSEVCRHPYLVPDFRGNGFRFFPLCMMLAIGLSYIAFIILWYSPFIPSFLGAFIMKWCWILSKASSAFIEMIKCFLYLLQLMCCITFIALCMSNHPCIPGMKPTWLWWMIFLICCWNWFAIILLRILYWCSLGRLPVALLFGFVLVWFGDECIVGLIEWVMQCSFFFFFGTFKECWY